MVSARRAAMPHDAPREFRRCLRERVRLARELADAERFLQHEQAVIDQLLRRLP